MLFASTGVALIISSPLSSRFPTDGPEAIYLNQHSDNYHPYFSKLPNSNEYGFIPNAFSDFSIPSAGAALRRAIL